MFKFKLKAIFLSLFSSAIISLGMASEELIDKKQTNSVTKEIEKNYFIGDKFYDKGLGQAQKWIEFYTTSDNNKLDALKGDILAILEKMTLNFKEEIYQLLKKNEDKKLKNEIFHKIEELRDELDELKKTKKEISPKHIEAFGAWFSGLAALAENNTLLNFKFDYNIFLSKKTSLLKNPMNFLSLVDCLFFNKIEKTDIIPIYSKNGAIGFNTIVYCLINGFIPVGFGEDPFEVHGNLYTGKRLQILKHDYADHGKKSRKLKNESPFSFNLYKKVYENIFLNGNEVINIKNDIFMLFFLIHELRLNLETDVFEEEWKEQLLNNKREYEADMENKDLFKVFSKGGAETYKINLLYNIVRDTLDLQKPLTNLGFEIPIKIENYSFNPTKLTFTTKPTLTFDKASEFNDRIYEIILVMWKGFTERHPQILLKKKEQ